LEVVASATAEEEQVATGFGAALAVTALGAGGALETSGILLLELVGGGEDALALLLPFLLVTRVKATSSISGASMSISTSEEEVGIGLELYTVLITSTKVRALV